MKKTLSFLLALVMAISCMTITVFAATVDKDNAGPVTFPVNIQTTGNSPEEEVGYDDPAAEISVDVVWEGTTFVYNFTNWNANNNQYNGSWANNSATITTTNNSNCAVNVANTFTAGTLPGGVTVGFEGATSATLATAITKGTAPSATFTLRATGKPTQEYSSATEIGTVTVTISNPNA